jgi:hypothetical protein
MSERLVFYTTSGISMLTDFLSSLGVIGGRKGS